MEIVRNSCPGPGESKRGDGISPHSTAPAHTSFTSFFLTSSFRGACGGMYTANTMASFLEVTGMCLPGTASTPAIHAAKRQECLRTGAAMKKLLELDVKPRDILTKEAFENGITLLTVLGGSTNAVIHLIAIARSGDVDLTIDDCENGTERVESGIDADSMIHSHLQSNGSATRYVFSE